MNQRKEHISQRLAVISDRLARLQERPKDPIRDVAEAAMKDAIRTLGDEMKRVDASLGTY